MVAFELKTKRGLDMTAIIEVGFYPKMTPLEPDQTGWLVTKADGWPLGTPTVNLAEYGQYPAPGCVFIKVTPEYSGWLESIVGAGLIEPTGRELAAGYVERYAIEARVLHPKLGGASPVRMGGIA